MDVIEIVWKMNAIYGAILHVSFLSIFGREWPFNLMASSELEFDKIWKIEIYYTKDHLIRILFVKQKIQKIHSSARHSIQETFDSNKDFYVNLFFSKKVQYSMFDGHCSMFDVHCRGHRPSNIHVQCSIFVHVRSNIEQDGH